MAALKIYAVPQNGVGIEDFVQHVRTLGNRVNKNMETGEFDIFSRNPDRYYETEEQRAIPYIVNNEIGNALEELHTVNKVGKFCERPVDSSETQPRASSLNDILNSRKNVDANESDSVKSLDSDNTNQNDSAEQEEIEGDQVDAQTSSEDTPSNELHESDISDTDDTDFSDLEALHQAADILNETRKQLLLKNIESVLNASLLTDTDILAQLAETADLKKTLSAVLAKFQISLSMTAVSDRYVATTKNVAFLPETVASPHYYREGVSRLFSEVDRILEQNKDFEENQLALRNATQDLTAHRQSTAERIVELRQEVETTRLAGLPKTLFQPKFEITFVRDNIRYYISKMQNAKTTESGEIPNKFLGITNDRSKAYRMPNLELARAQVKRIKSNPQNCAFLLNDLGEVKAVPNLNIARLGYDYVE